MNRSGQSIGQIHSSDRQRQGRLLVISDIHGYKDAFLHLLQSAQYDAGTDRLILLGDFIDAYKPSTWKTLDLIRKLQSGGAIAIAGNHELKLGSPMPRLRRSSQAKRLHYWSWLRVLPHYHIENGFLFVHAGVRPGMPLERQTVKDVTGIRLPFYTAAPDQLRPPLSPNGAAATAAAAVSVIVFGHTPTYKLGAAPGTIWRDSARIGIDTGAKLGQRLTLLDLSSGLAYSCATGARYGYGDFRISQAFEPRSMPFI